LVEEGFYVVNPLQLVIGVEGTPKASITEKWQYDRQADHYHYS